MSVAEDSTSYKEYEIEAGFIYKFISFVSWPGKSIEKNSVTIGIFGKGPLGGAFKDVEGKSVGGRTLKIKMFPSDTDLSGLKVCDVLYVPSSEQAKIETIIKALAGSPTLTVGDTPGFIDKGGMIGFVRKPKGRLGIEINAESAGRSGISIRSMLKRIAARVIRRQGRSKEAQSNEAN